MLSNPPCNHGPPYEEKVAKGPQYSQQTPPPAGAHACNRVALIITISCIKNEY